MVYSFAKESYEWDVFGESSFTDTRSFTPQSNNCDPIDEAIFFFHPSLTYRQILLANQEAFTNGTDIGEELINLGFIGPRQHYMHVADTLGLRYLDVVEAEQVVPHQLMDVILRRQGPLRYDYDGRVMIVVSPDIAQAMTLQQQIATFPSLKDRILITCPNQIKNGIWHHKPKERLQRTLLQLAESMPQKSAKQVFSAKQAFLIGVLLAVLTFTMFGWTINFMNYLHIGMSALFFSFNMLKLASAFSNSNAKFCKISSLASNQLPVYTVLVALYQEAGVVAQLTQALSRIDWPKSKLDIKLICEQDDPATIKALKRLKLGQQFEIVVVPQLGPRTKPKALQYALQGARGDFITVYDAEDIPHPNQIKEAYLRFYTSSSQLACLQAPLVISNGKNGWLPSLFALEYAGLFRKLLPMLARFGLPVQLGGTSNHFRKQALDAVGGWDPYNVTEDADLGIRLHRHGYHTHVLCHPTLEHAPEKMGIWLRQRTRWLKGWMQTWLVLMRQPLVALQNLGLLGFLALQVLVGGMLVSALVHPFVYLFVFTNTLVASLYGIESLPLFVMWLLIIDSFNLLAGYMIFGHLGWRAFIAGEKKLFDLKWFCVIPIYWLIISLAGWRALYHLFRRAHHWEKTPHTPIETVKFKNQ